MTGSFDDLLHELTELKGQIAALESRHDELPWDAFDERFRLKAEQRELEERVALLRKQASDPGVPV